MISVYNKDGIVHFARTLEEMGWNIIASGGTAKKLKEDNIAVSDVAEVVGGNAILGHRVVTLSREIAAGLLAQDNNTDRAELELLGIPWIDLVCVDLYPLEAEIGKEGATRDSVIEQTDIGGPTLLREAAKGRRIVICEAEDRQRVLTWLANDEPDCAEFLNDLAAKAEGYVARYCLASARYHSAGSIDGMIGTRVQTCKYGENAWQTPAGLFSTGTNDPLALDKFELVAGTAPSYNNFCDIDRLLQTMTHVAAGFDVNTSLVPQIALGAKHGNCCGAAVDDRAHLVATGHMLKGNQRAIFGGLVMLNFTVDANVAEHLLHFGMDDDRPRLLDGIIAPEFDPVAIETLKRKGGKCRLLANPALKSLRESSLDQTARFRNVRGGFLVQPNYTFVFDIDDPDLSLSRELTTPQHIDVLLAWAVGSTSNSNTITLVKDGMLIGNGTGQQDRVGCCELAVKRARDAGHDPCNAVAYSDSFFPFTDAVGVLAQEGISVILTSS
ncbi:MAG: hypothetical protein AAB774_00060 [Patescibacteria group bacterium]